MTIGNNRSRDGIGFARTTDHDGDWRFTHVLRHQKGV